jgi:hypothetical protein
MLSQLQTNETQTNALFEKVIEEIPTDNAQPEAPHVPPSDVEEIRTDEAITGKTASNTKPQKSGITKNDEPNPLLLDPYEFDLCTITIIYTRTRDTQVSVSVHSHKDEPIVKTYPQVEVRLPEQIEGVMQKLFEIWPDGKITATLVLLPTESDTKRKMVISIRAGSDTPIVLAGPAWQFPLPAPITSMLSELKELLPVHAMKKMEKEAKENSKTNLKPAAAKTSAPIAPKIIPARVDGKTQMTLF